MQGQWDNGPAASSCLGHLVGALWNTTGVNWYYQRILDSSEINGIRWFVFGANWNRLSFVCGNYHRSTAKATHWLQCQCALKLWLPSMYYFVFFHYISHPFHFTRLHSENSQVPMVCLYICTAHPLGAFSREQCSEIARVIVALTCLSCWIFLSSLFLLPPQRWSTFRRPVFSAGHCMTTVLAPAAIRIEWVFCG